MRNHFFRRTLLISFWPITDFIITVLANVLIVNLGVIRAVIGTAIAASILNVVFLHLLSFEKELYSWVAKQKKGFAFLRFERLSVKIGKTFAVLIAYVVSGPAMVGAPVIWLLGIRSKKAYTLAILGVTLNSIIWVGGFYHLIWILIKTAIIKGAPIFL